MPHALRQLAARATAALTPTASAVVVVVFVVWVLARPFLPLAGALASVVDTATTLSVLLAAVLIEASREPPLAGKNVDPPVGGRPTADWPQ